ncbi:hypothetical protein H6776_01880 [Candidatus Nomurabacteria bacterium]|nr:hypothetical protein [Candidatus Nomurabacteria bacterium]
MKHIKEINTIKKISGTQKFVSFFGKSTVPTESESYQFTEAATRFVLSKEYGVIHGGYAGGCMQAVADSAYTYLQEHQLPQERNIAIPQREHDEVGWDRVANATFTSAARNIFERLELVTGQSQYVCICPRGGDGTLLEIGVLYHTNSLAPYTGDAIVPMIFLQTPDGTDWKKIMQNLTKDLDSSYQSVEEIPWMHFVSSIEELSEIIK